MRGVGIQQGHLSLQRGCPAFGCYLTPMASVGTKMHKRLLPKAGETKHQMVQVRSCNSVKGAARASLATHKQVGHQRCVPQEVPTLGLAFCGPACQGHVQISGIGTPAVRGCQHRVDGPNDMGLRVPPSANPPLPAPLLAGIVIAVLNQKHFPIPTRMG